MRKNQGSIDGFVPRNPAKTSPSVEGNKNRQAKQASVSSKKKKPTVSKKRAEKYDDLEKALENLDVADKKNDVIAPKSDKSIKKDKKLGKKLLKKNKKREQKGKKPLTLKQFKKRRVIKRFFLIILLILAIVGGYYIHKTLNNFGNLFGGNPFDLFSHQKLKEDSQGRTNILIFATNPEDRIAADNDSGLTDSIMVLSVNQETKDVYTVSLPRDLYVKHSCPTYLGTTSGKLNETYICGQKEAEDNGANITDSEKSGQKALATTAQEVLGLEIQYTAHLNWEVLTGIVDALGGIEVVVDTYDGSPYMYDSRTNVNYKNGERVQLNGERALAFSRARYELSGGAFDRERNQQKVLAAIVEKVNSSGKSNPVALMGMFNALGENVKTDFQASEIQTIADIAKDFDASKIKSLPLLDDKNDIRLMTTDNIGGSSVVVPTAGLYNYQDIKSYIAKNTSNDPVLKEEAKIVILNGTTISGLASEQEAKLLADGYNITNVDSAPEQTYKQTKIYKLNDKKPKTFEKLKDKLNASTDDKNPSWINQYEADIVIILGENE